MTKANITEYDNTASNNTDVQDVPLGENLMYPSHVNNAFREIMADLADINDGTVALTSPSATSLSVTNNITVGGTVDGRDVATDGAKLDGIEAGATNVSALTDLSITDGTNGQVLTTNGAGTFTFSTVSASNADTLDNLDSTQFLRSDATDTTTGYFSVDNHFRVINSGVSGQGDNHTHFNYQDTGVNYIRGTSTYFNSPIDIAGNNIACDTNKGFSNSGSWTRNQTPYGYIEFGPANTSYAHIYTDRANFYFNKKIYHDAGNLVASTKFNTVGSYCLAHHTSSNSSLTANASISGSSLRAVGFFHLISNSSNSAYYPDEDGSALSGTWRVMGEARDNSSPTTLRPATLFVRIS